MLVVSFNELGGDNGCSNLGSSLRRLGRSPAGCSDHPVARVQHMSVSVPQILTAETVLHIVLTGRPMDIRLQDEPIV